MARARNIKPGFYANEELASCSIHARYIFPGLWMQADRAGRLEDRPLRLKAAIMPYDPVDMDALLNELENAGLIERYETDGCRYIWIKNFEKHQNPHVREPESTIPAPCKHSASTIPAPCENSSSPADSPLLIPDSPVHIFPASQGATAPVDQQLFSRGLDILKARGVEEKNARSFVGLMRKRVGDVKAMELLLMADDQDISNPLAWLTRALEPRKEGHRGKTRTEQLAETGRALTGRTQSPGDFFGVTVEGNREIVS